MHRRRLLPDRHGGQARATFDLVAPLAHEATAMCTTEIAGHTAPGRSGTVSPLIDASLRRGDIDQHWKQIVEQLYAIAERMGANG